MSRALPLNCPQCGVEVEFRITSADVEVTHAMYQASWRAPITMELGASVTLRAFHTCADSIESDGTIPPADASTPQRPPNGEYPMKLRIAAVVVSIAAIITAGVVNTATAGTDPYVPGGCISTAGCQGAPIVTQPAPVAPEAPQTAQPAPIEAPAAATGETKPAPAVAPTTPRITEPAAVEAPVAAPKPSAEPKSGCN